MANSAPSEPARENTSPVVEVRVRANADQLSVLRALASAIAIQHDFDLDTVEDVKLAVDEGATRLIMSATEGATLSCGFQPHGFGLSIVLSAPTDPDAAIGNTRSFGWHVLESLTDSVSVRAGVDEQGSNVTTIDLVITESGALR